MISSKQSQRRPNLVALWFAREKKWQRRKRRVANSASAANPAPAANSGSAAISKIDMNGCESQNRNRIVTINAIAAIVAAFAIARRMTNHQCAFSKMVSKLLGCLTRSMWVSVSVVVSNQGTNTFWRYAFTNTFWRSLFTPARRSLSRRKIACVSTYRNWRERIQKFVCKYPFRGSVRIYEDSNIFIFLVLKESVLKENLLAQIESFVLIIENNN